MEEITNELATIVNQAPKSLETHNRKAEILQALLTSCEEAHEAETLEVNTLNDDYAYKREQREGLREQAAERLNRVYLSLKNGGKPSDYE